MRIISSSSARSILQHGVKHDNMCSRTKATRRRDGEQTRRENKGGAGVERQRGGISSPHPSCGKPFSTIAPVSSGGNISFTAALTSFSSSLHGSSCSSSHTQKSTNARLNQPFRPRNGLDDRRYLYIFPALVAAQRAGCAARVN